MAGFPHSLFLDCLDTSRPSSVTAPCGIITRVPPPVFSFAHSLPDARGLIKRNLMPESLDPLQSFSSMQYKVVDGSKGPT